MTKESNVQGELKKALACLYRDSFIWKMTDRLRLGVPDDFVWANGKAAWIELKSLDGITKDLGTTKEQRFHLYEAGRKGCPSFLLARIGGKNWLLIDGISFFLCFRDNEGTILGRASYFGDDLKAALKVIFGEKDGFDKGQRI
jgi:hypothetical protein